MEVTNKQNEKMIKYEIQIKNCLDDLYQLGVIQGEHNINWTDEYNLLEPSNKYYHKTKNIANKHGRSIEIFPEDYRVNDEEKYALADKLGFNINEITKEHILNIITENY